MMYTLFICAKYEIYYFKWSMNIQGVKALFVQRTNDFLSYTHTFGNKMDTTGNHYV